MMMVNGLTRILKCIIVAHRFVDNVKAPSEQSAADGEDQLRILITVIERAEAKLTFQSQDIDSHDTKALAFIALNLAGCALLVTVRDALQPWWWVPLIGAGVSTLLFMSTLWPRLFDFGPNLEQFYEKWGGSTGLDFHRQLMGEYLNAIEKNRNILPSKERAFNLGAAILLITVIGGAIVLWQTRT